jgi:Helix-hairpin-helix motif
LHGLVILGFAAVLVGFVASLTGPGRRQSDIGPENCVYEVYLDDHAIGTVFLKHAENLPKILAILGLKPFSREKCGRIPCNRTIRINSANKTLLIDKIQGSHLIAAGKRVDLNLADVGDLQAVPGIGPRLSQRIISTRRSMGGFRSLDDLLQVPRIGRKRLSYLIQYLEVGSMENSGDQRNKEPRPECLGR